MTKPSSHLFSIPVVLITDPRAAGRDGIDVRVRGEGQRRQRGFGDRGVVGAARWRRVGNRQRAVGRDRAGESCLSQIASDSPLSARESSFSPLYCPDGN